MEAIPTLIVLAVALGGFLLWFAALVDLVRRPESELRWDAKPLWLIVVLFGHAAGAILYLLLGRAPSAPTHQARPTM
jgi:hypothetical protein